MVKVLRYPRWPYIVSRRLNLTLIASTDVTVSGEQHQSGTGNAV